LLDSKKVSRRSRAFAGWIILLFMVFLVHIWSYMYQKNYTRASVKTHPTMDISDKAFPAHIWLYIFMGMLDAMWQTATYWMMGAMSNDLAKLAFLTGFYKSLQSAGAAGVWRADAVLLPYMNIFLSTWILLIVGLIFALPVLYLRVKDHTDMADETVAQLHDKDEVRYGKEH